MKIPKKIEYLLKSKEGEALKLDIGCGQDKQPGFISIDWRDLKGVDIVHDLEQYPYPLPNETFMLMKAVHVVERINPLDKGFIKWMDEMWRILKFDGQILISTYYAGSPGYWGDPCNVNGCTNHTWHYFDPLGEGKLYKVYKPKPWKIEKSYSNPDGLMEVLLTKRREDISYEKI